MNTAKLLNDIEQLPPEAQQKIEDIVGLMKDYYLSSEKNLSLVLQKAIKVLIQMNFLVYGKTSLEN
jgi:hypothetical protein